MWPNTMTGYGMGIWMLFGIFFWVLVVVGVVLLVIWVVQKASGERSGVEESALEILKKRYARGEISKEEYEGKRRDLST